MGHAASGQAGLGQVVARIRGRITHVYRTAPPRRAALREGDSGWLSPQPVDCLATQLNMNGLPARLPEVEAQMVELEGVLA